jgi:hypothetical protein
MAPASITGMWCESHRRHDATDVTQPQAAGVPALPGLRHGVPEQSAVVLAGLRRGRKAPDRGRATQAPDRREAEGPTVMALPASPWRHWRSYGTEPLPTATEAMTEPMRAFPSWFLKITCDRCGKDRRQRGSKSPRAVAAPGAICAASILFMHSGA